MDQSWRMFRLFLTLPILLNACLKDETISGYADRNSLFKLHEINAQPFGATATISFPEQGVIAGQGPCNSYSATQSAPLPWFEPGAIASTRRACPDMVAETEFFASLASMTQIEVAGPVIILRNDAGGEMVFRSDQD